jgi:succinate dehydrogenase hydrophobic anchor subunit
VYFIAVTGIRCPHIGCHRHIVKTSLVLAITAVAAVVFVDFVIAIAILHNDAAYTPFITLPSV